MERMSQSFSKPLLYPLFVSFPKQSSLHREVVSFFCRLSFDTLSYLVYKDPKKQNSLSLRFMIMVTQFHERVGKTIP